jgi:hypothetical protein
MLLAAVDGLTGFSEATAGLKTNYLALRQNWPPKPWMSSLPSVISK